MKIVHSNISQDLIQGCKDEKRLAQKQLYEKCYGRMMGVCMRYASDRDDAREILNVGFFKVFKNIRKFDSDQGSIESWIYKIMINTAIDHVRKEAKHRYHDEIEEVYDLYDGTGDVLESMGAEEIMELVQDLSPAYRAVFNLYVVDGFNHREIGDRLGISEGTSKSNLAKARARLQEMIRKRDPKKYNAYVKKG